MNPEYLHPTYQGGVAGPAGANDSSDNDIPLDPNHASGGSFDGAGSERASEASHFTSISERPVNPNWPGPSPSGQPGAPGGPPGPGGPAPNRRQQDVLLAANPDFSVPGIGVRGARARAGTGPMAASAVGGQAAGGLTGQGRYPTEI